jgi:transcriptional pleiotropic regulator of transition state genes
VASSGIRRKVDDLGRVVIPAAIRRSLGIREGDAVEVTVEGERVVLSRPHDACVFCGREEDDPARFRGRLVCHTCLKSLTGGEDVEVAAPARHADASVAAWEAAGRDPAASATAAPPGPAADSAPPGPPASAAASAPHGPPARSGPRPWPTAPDPDRTGPIDGDAAARAAARRQDEATAADATEPDTEVAGHPVPAARRREPQPPRSRPGPSAGSGPASTTAW